MKDIKKFYRVERIDIYHDSGITIGDIKTDEPSSVFEYFKEMKELITKSHKDFPEFTCDGVIIQADFISVRDVSDEFVKLWLICEMVTGFTVQKINAHHNVAEKFKNYELTGDDYQYAFTQYYWELLELLKH